jgi:thiosulfate dehydrogenase
MTFRKPLLLVAVALMAVVAGLSVSADEFETKDVDRWQEEFMAVVTKGRALWVDGSLGTNGVACAQCHPNGANTHPETYPKFQKQIGRVITLREMINWCLINPLEGEAMKHDDPRMLQMEAYLAHERRGVALAPGKH